jgi:RNA-binding protein Luc7-like 2
MWFGVHCAGVDGGDDKHFTDRAVCRPFLLDICISDLFTNTRAELPDCTKIHSMTMKEEYEKASMTRDYRFEEEVLEYLKAFLTDNDRKIEANRKRLDVTEDNPEMEAKSQEIHELAVQIGEKVSKAEAMGQSVDILRCPVVPRATIGIIIQSLVLG